MVRVFFISIFLLCNVISYAQIDLLKEATKSTKQMLGNQKITEQEVAQGLKEALNIGVIFAVNKASALDGFYVNERIRIPFPEKANSMKNTLIKAGMKSQVQDFEKVINRAAEQASVEAAPILSEVITEISIDDAFEILNGSDYAATQYLERETSVDLISEFEPIVIRAIQEMQVRKYWNFLATSYNKIPFTKKIEVNLEKYITKKGIEGLFVLVADQEKNIRRNSQARKTAILKKVFK